jgi:hypothetical protein
MDSAQLFARFKEGLDISSIVTERGLLLKKSCLYSPLRGVVMKLLILPLFTTALIISAAQDSYLCWPVTVHLLPSVLATVSPGFSDAVGLDTIPGRSKYPQIHGTYRDKDSFDFLILATGDKNGGEKNGEDKDDSEKDDKSQGKDKDEGGGWDRLWDSPMLG